MPFLRKYGTGTGADIWIPIIKRGVQDFAVGADWTPAVGDVKVTKDGAAAADIGTLPVALAMGNTALWKFVFSNAELQAKEIVVTVADAATKAVEDQSFIIETFGNASAMYPPDFADSVRLGLTALPNAAAEAAGGLYTRGAGVGQIAQSASGQIDVNLERVRNAIVNALISGRVDANAQIVGDKTGYALAAAEYTALVNSVWDELTSEARTASSYGQKFKDLTVDANGRVKADVERWLGAVMNALISGRLDVNAQVLGTDVVDSVTLATTGVNEIRDAILQATISELAQAQPPTTPQLQQAIMLLYMALRNASKSTATERRILNDAATVIAKATMSDDGTTFDQGKLVSGP